MPSEKRSVNKKSGGYKHPLVYVLLYHTGREFRRIKTTDLDAPVNSVAALLPWLREFGTLAAPCVACGDGEALFHALYPCLMPSYCLVTVFRHSNS